jgi:catalase (peroxidase I)
VLYQNYTAVISKADFWVLAANTMIEYATTATSNPSSVLDTVPNILKLPFRYGRLDAPSCNDTGFLPSANFNWTQMNNLFGGRFGMNTNEIVAIMGGHTLGKATFSNSGFDGGKFLNKKQL